MDVCFQLSRVFINNGTAWPIGVLLFVLRQSLCAWASWVADYRCASHIWWVCLVFWGTSRVAAPSTCSPALYRFPALPHAQQHLRFFSLSAPLQPGAHWLFGQPNEHACSVLCSLLVGLLVLSLLWKLVLLCRPFQSDDFYVMCFCSMSYLFTFTIVSFDIEELVIWFVWSYVA